MRKVLQRVAMAVAATLELLALGRPVAAQPTILPSRPVASAADLTAAYVAEASQRFGIPAAWIRAVMRVESAGEVGVTSSAGAIGLMQVMPQTYATLRAKFNLGLDPYDPHDNIMAGAAFLREMHDRYGDAGFLAAYNAGPGRYEEFRAGGRALPSETILYMARLGPMLGVAVDVQSLDNMPRVVGSPEQAPIFVVLHGGGAPSNLQRGSATMGNLAAANVQADDRSAALFMSRILQPARAMLTDNRAVATEVAREPTGTTSARPRPADGQPDTIFAPTIRQPAGR